MANIPCGESSWLKERYCAVTFTSGYPWLKCHTTKVPDRHSLLESPTHHTRSQCKAILWYSS
jgi:hypothetical protein